MILLDLLFVPSLHTVMAGVAGLNFQPHALEVLSDIRQAGHCCVLSLDLTYWTFVVARHTWASTGLQLGGQV